MASCKDERNSVLATLWYQIAHYCVRPWPWIMISFVALALYPELRVNYIADDAYDPGIGFPMVMRELCTPGLAGLMLVAFFAAFMSTMSTQMNWGASYLVRDFIQPIFMKESSERGLAIASRVASVAILATGLLFGIVMKYPSLLTGQPATENESISVDDAWKFLAALGAGTGLVFMLRWFWWRINAWSEIVAMVASLTYFILLNNPGVQEFMFSGYAFKPEEQMAIVAGLTIVTWLAATLITPAESQSTLRSFFKKIRPGGPGWKPIAALEPDVVQDKNLGISIIGALFASGIVYLTLPAIGYFIFGKTNLGLACIAGAGVCVFFVALITRKIFK
jgi:Na+/proline symporter